MLKVRIPLSGVAAVPALILGATPLQVCIIGIIIEVLVGAVVLRKILSNKNFQYDSLDGQLLTQYIIFPKFSPTEIIHLIMARIAAFAFVGIELLYYAPSIILYLLTVIHYVPNKKARR